MREHWLKRLENLQDDYSDEIPERKFHGSISPDERKYKVRKNWWQWLIGALQGLLSSDSISHTLDQETRNFVQHYSSEKFHNQELTTQEDINKANSLIKRILKGQSNRTRKKKVVLDKKIPLLRGVLREPNNFIASLRI